MGMGAYLNGIDRYFLDLDKYYLAPEKKANLIHWQIRPAFFLGSDQCLLSGSDVYFGLDVPDWILPSFRSGEKNKKK